MNELKTLNSKNQAVAFGVRRKHKVTLEDVINSIKELDSKLTARLDNLENEVHSQFKAHGWIK